MNEKDLALFTGKHSLLGEQIFEMLSRKEYTNEQIADFVGCPDEAVLIVAKQRKGAIEKNHAVYMEYRRQMDAIMVHGRYGRRETSGNEVLGFLAILNLYGGRRRFRAVERMYE